MGLNLSVGKFNSKYTKVRIFQAIIKSTDCWPVVRGAGMIPDFHMLCCIIIIFLFARVRMKILYMYMLKMTMSVHLVFLVEPLRLRSIVGMLLMITLFILFHMICIMTCTWKLRAIKNLNLNLNLLHMNEAL